MRITGAKKTDLYCCEKCTGKKCEICKHLPYVHEENAGIPPKTKCLFNKCECNLSMKDIDKLIV